MILVCKLTSIAWNVQDGQVNETTLSIYDKDGYQKQHLLKHAPSLLEFLSYTFFFAGFLTGPWTDFVEYKSFVDKSMFKSENFQIPSATYFVLKKFVLVIIALALYKLSDTYNIMFLTSNEFLTYSLWKRILLFVLFVELFYQRYYIVWWLGEAATALIGLSYNGRDSNQNLLWNRILMLNLWHYKFAKSISHDVAPNWNVMSQRWLKRYVHHRLIIFGFSRQISRISTFITSAFWHGLYPGYFSFFIQISLFNEASNLLYPTILPYFVDQNGVGIYPRKYLLDWGTTLTILLSIDYLASGFQLLAFSYTIQAFNSVYWIGHIILFLVIIIWAIHHFLWPKHLLLAQKLIKSELKKKL